MGQKFKIKETYPSIDDLRKKAHSRLPHFALEYLECGTGRDEALKLNEAALSNIRYAPEFMAGHTKPVTQAKIFGKEYAQPIGIAPVGMASLVWPGAEKKLALMARDGQIPFCMSTLAAEQMETIVQAANEFAWFQLYPMRDRSIRDKMIDRARSLSFEVLVLTVDVPTPSVRERQKRAGLSVPPRKDISFWWNIIKNPSWAMSSLMRGEPKFLTLEDYVPSDQMRNQSQFFADQMGGTLDWDYVEEVRNLWDGPLVLKGIVNTKDALQCQNCGVDGIWVSNHGGRQFDACVPAIDSLRDIRKTLGVEATIFFDSGIRSGLDAFRAINLGADMVFAGRPFVYGVAADPKTGHFEALNILERDLKNAMIQTGCQSLGDIRYLKSKS